METLKSIVRNYWWFRPLLAAISLFSVAALVLSILAYAGVKLQPICTKSSHCQKPENVCLQAACQNRKCVTKLKTLAECAFDAECTTQYGSNIYTCDLSLCACVINDPLCPNAANPCITFVSNTTTLRCDEQLKVGATCYSNAQCQTLMGSPYYHCNLDSCGCYYVPPAINITACPIPENTCQTYIFNGTACAEELAPGSSCFSDEQCVVSNGGNPFYKCNTTSPSTGCSCYKAPQCVDNSDCPAPSNTCLSAICTDGICTTVLKINATCSSNAQCSTLHSTPDYTCNLNNCSCVFTPVNLICTSSAQCTQPQNQCLVANCTGGLCLTNLKSGATCSSTSQCALITPGSQCNMTSCECTGLGFLARTALFASTSGATLPISTNNVVLLDTISTPWPGTFTLNATSHEISVLDVMTIVATTSAFVGATGLALSRIYFRPQYDSGSGYTNISLAGMGFQAPILNNQASISTTFVFSAVANSKVRVVADVSVGSALYTIIAGQTVSPFSIFLRELSTP